MRAREGELIESNQKVIFDVKGLVHPPNKIIAFPRYIPSLKGNREKQGEIYGKMYNLAERFNYLQQEAPELIVNDPVFGERLCEVPIKKITRHFDPIEKLAELRQKKDLAELERKVVELAEQLKTEANIPWNSMGISGSVLVGLYTLQSDIDPLVYGTENCIKAYQALQNILQDKSSDFQNYTGQELHNLFDFRSKDTIMSFENFIEVESRKAFQGMFQKTDYFIRFVKDWIEVKENYGDKIYENCGYSKIKATVIDDSKSLYTPCSYEIGNVKTVEGPHFDNLSEISSFRGRFCKQAEIGEKVYVQGKVERVNNKKESKIHYRIIIGNRPSDYMVLCKR